MGCAEPGLAFAPVTSGPFRSLFTTGSGWGRVEIDADTLTLHLDGGTLDIGELKLHGTSIARSIRLVAGESHTTRLPQTPTPEES